MPSDPLADAINNLSNVLRDQYRGGSRNVSEPRRPENFPGYRYLQRVNSALTNSLTALTENYNDNWGRMKDGSYTFGDCVRTWAIAWDTYYDLGTELIKGPDAADRVEWLHFSYTLGNPPTPDVLKSVANIGRKCSFDAELEITPLASLSSGDSVDLMTCQWADRLRRDQVEIELNVTQVKRLDKGHYIGFVLERGNTGIPPLVIVMLHVR